jgi:thiol-disulfide isomerase/thioredoxin
MRLRDHRGKVVLLSFWHGHCPPCRAMFPHERALVQKFAAKPFVLLGVSADESPEALQQFTQQFGLTWASWWDGPGGPIASVWGVDRFPAFFLIDQQGVVRLRHLGAPPEGLLESKIEQLLQEQQSSL